MTQQHIEEFLKYASPRLDYIGHCMEKQALSAATIARAIAKARTPGLPRTSKGKLPRLLGEDTRVLQRPDGSQSVMYRSPYDSGFRVVHDDVDGFGQKYLFDEKSGIAHKLHEGSKDARQYKFVPRDTSTQTSIVPANSSHTDIIPATPVQHSVSTNVANKADDAKQPKGKKTSAPDTKDTANWLKTHPYLTAAGTAAGGSALGTGLGYALGHSSGSEEAAKKLHTYYAINEALRSNALRRANSDILARLANIFGMGELNNLIGG